MRVPRRFSLCRHGHRRHTSNWFPLQGFGLVVQVQTASGCAASVVCPMGGTSWGSRRLPGPSAFLLRASMGLRISPYPWPKAASPRYASLAAVSTSSCRNPARALARSVRHQSRSPAWNLPRMLLPCCEEIGAGCSCRRIRAQWTHALNSRGTKEDARKSAQRDAADGPEGVRARNRGAGGGRIPGTTAPAAEPAQGPARAQGLARGLEPVQGLGQVRTA